MERWRLGTGAHGLVRRGRRVADEVLVAVKLIKRKTTSEFVKDVAYEANLMLRLRHENIVNIHDVYDTPQMLYIVIEFAEGTGCLL